MRCHSGWWLTTFNFVQLERGQLQVNVILLQLPESFSFFVLSCKLRLSSALPNSNNKARIKIIMNSGSCSQMLSSWKWPIGRKKDCSTNISLCSPPPLPSQATETFGITVILTQPRLVSVVRWKVLMFIGNVADWQRVQGVGERSLKQYPNRPEKNVQKHEKLTWKFQGKSCSTIHLHFLQTNSIITGGLFTSQGVTFKPQNNQFSFCPCMNFRSYGLEQQTVRSLIGKQGFGQFWFFWPDD